LEGSIFYGNTEDEGLKLSNGEERMLFNSKEDSIRLLSKKMMDVSKNVTGEALRNMKLCGAVMKKFRDNRHANSC
jgi:hypothetical protein